MNGVRLFLRSAGVAVLMCQIGALSALFLPDCCAAHRAASQPAEQAEPACPLHHDPAPTPTCRLRSNCDGPLAALLAALASPGVPSATATIAPDRAARIARVPSQPRIFSRLTPPDGPPPRA